MPRYRTLDELNCDGARVLVRVDLNLPVVNGQVSDRTRVRRVAPTLTELAEHGAIVVAVSHFDRPKGRVVAEMSLEPLAPVLAEELGREVTFVATDWTDDNPSHAIAAASPGDILLMENTRFHPGEEANDKAFATTLSGFADAYVNDAFSTAHRAHASTEGVAHLLPCFAGRAMQDELEALDRALTNPAHPVTAVVGGAKISTKLELLGTLTAKVDSLIIGGGMANTFLAAEGHMVGKSLCEHDLLDTARDILRTAKSAGCAVILPSDVVLAREFKAHAPHRIAQIDDVGDDEMILDAGPQSGETIAQLFARSRTLVWNGPLGAFELAPFDAATTRAAQCAAELTKAGDLLSVAGGGDTVAALEHAGAAADFSYISTAGGAFLEWLEGKPLPGVKVLDKDPASTSETTLLEAG
jgi:phosphoglycerate kinase